MGDYVPSLFPQSRGWLNSVWGEEPQGTGRFSKSKVAESQKSRQREILIKPSTCARNQWSTAQWLSVPFNLLDEHGTVWIKYEICILGTDLASSFEPTAPMTQSSDWQCKDLGYISRKLILLCLTPDRREVSRRVCWKQLMLFILTENLYLSAL